MKPDYRKAGLLFLQHGELSISTCYQCGISSRGANVRNEISETATVIALEYLAKVPARIGEHRKEYR